MAQNQGSDSDEDKTEEPSSQRLEDFREEGQVAQSKELTSILVLVATLGSMYAMGPSLMGDFTDFMRKMLAESALTELTTEKAGSLLLMSLGQCAKLVLPIAIAGFFAGVFGSVLQFGFLFTWKPLEPQLDRINPLGGFKRIVAVSSLVEGLKSILKLKYC